MLNWMLISLLAMNCVLALGLICLWRGQRDQRQETADLGNRLTGLQDQVLGLEAKGDRPSSPETCPSKGRDREREIRSRLEAAQAKPSSIPDRYKAAVNMADSGLSSTQIAKMLDLSSHETRQLTSLAKISHEADAAN